MLRWLGRRELVGNVTLSRLARFVVLYYSHILTTLPIPIALLVLGVVSPIRALSLVLLLAGFWTIVGAFTMVSEDTKQLKKMYAVVGVALVAGSMILWL